MRRDDVEKEVIAAVRAIAARAAKPPSIAPEQTLTGDLGLQSLDIAELVAVLEVTFGVDPFAAAASIADMRTVADLVTAYAGALGA